MPVVNAGVAGSVLTWFLWRAERRLERIERALDRLARAQMLALVSRADVAEPVRHYAESILHESHEGCK